MGTSYTTCNNIVNNFNGIFTNLAGIGFDSHASHYMEVVHLIVRKRTNSARFIFILNVLGVFASCFQQFSLLQCCRNNSLISPESQLVIQTVEYVKLFAVFQCHSQPYGCPPQTTAALYWAVLNKICISSLNQGYFQLQN